MFYLFTRFNIYFITKNIIKIGTEITVFHFQKNERGLEGE